MSMMPPPFPAEPSDEGIPVAGSSPEDEEAAPPPPAETPFRTPDPRQVGPEDSGAG